MKHNLVREEREKVEVQVQDMVRLHAEVIRVRDQGLVIRKDMGKKGGECPYLKNFQPVVSPEEDF